MSLLSGSVVFHDQHELSLDPLHPVEVLVAGLPTVQYSAVQYSTMQYCTVLYSTMQYSTVPSRAPCRDTPGTRTPARGSSPCTMHMHMSDEGGS